MRTTINEPTDFQATEPGRPYNRIGLQQKGKISSAGIQKDVHDPCVLQPCKPLTSGRLQMRYRYCGLCWVAFRLPCLWVCSCPKMILWESHPTLAEGVGRVIEWGSW